MKVYGGEIPEEPEFPGYTDVDDSVVTTSGEAFKIQYEPSERWHAESGYPNLFFDGTDHYSDKDADTDYYTMTFTGTGIEIWASKNPAHANFDVYIDDVKVGSGEAKLESGSAVHQQALRQILAHCRARDIYVMVDETYAEFAPDLEAITAIPLIGEFDNLLVLRGVSKFFAAPGLRLGYGMTSNSGVLSYINSTKNPWTLNSLAAAAGCQMFADEAYIQKTRQFTLQELDRLCTLLRREEHLHVYEPSANFVLLRLCKPGLTSEMAFEHCIRQGLMIRDCSSFPGLGDNHIRFCLHLPEQNDRLMAALHQLLA